MPWLGRTMSLSVPQRLPHCSRFAGFDWVPNTFYAADKDDEQNAIVMVKKGHGLKIFHIVNARAY
jgi:hypothetical protein